MSCRGRKDFLPTIAFLTQRVLSYTEQDYSKLRRLMNYVHDTIDLIAIVGIEDMCRLCTWINAANAVYPNMRSHTGGTCTFRTGVFSTMSAKQKLNTGSSTESEVIENSDFITKPICYRLFMEAQGYLLVENVVYEDNVSTIKLLINSRKSYRKRSHHIEIQHYFVKDVIDKKKITMRYCPTKLILADFLVSHYKVNCFFYLET